LLDDFLEGGERERRLGADYLAAAARAYNRRVPEEGEIVAFEVEKYRWNFVASPEQAVEPRPGERLAGRRVEVGVEER
jgi:hypothetical protein